MEETRFLDAAEQVVASIGGNPREHIRWFVAWSRAEEIRGENMRGLTYAILDGIKVPDADDPEGLDEELGEIGDTPENLQRILRLFFATPLGISS